MRMTESKFERESKGGNVNDINRVAMMACWENKEGLS